MLSVFLSNLKSFEVLNALVTLTFATNGGGQRGGSRENYGVEKGNVRRERKDWEVVVGVIKGRGGEKNGEIMQQYSIFRNRKKGWSGEATKKVTGVGRFEPSHPQNQ